MTPCAIKDCDEKAVKCGMCTLHFEVRLDNKQAEVKKGEENMRPIDYEQLKEMPYVTVEQVLRFRDAAFSVIDGLLVDAEMKEKSNEI